MLKENVNPQRTVTGFGTTSARLVLRWTGKPGAKSNAEGEGVQGAMLRVRVCKELGKQLS